MGFILDEELRLQILRARIGEDPDLPYKRLQPRSTAPPEDVFGGLVPLGGLFARSDHAAVAITDGRAFETGLTFSLLVYKRGVHLEDRMIGAATSTRLAGDGAFSDASDIAEFVVGIRLPDGSFVSGTGVGGGRGQRGLRRTGRSYRLGASIRHQDSGAESELALVAYSGSSANLMSRIDYWLSPLPPPPHVLLVFHWPTQGIDRAELAMDSLAIATAASEARPIWRSGRQDQGT